jgi:hypothetical protein
LRIQGAAAHPLPAVFPQDLNDRIVDELASMFPSGALAVTGDHVHPPGGIFRKDLQDTGNQRLCDDPDRGDQNRFRTGQSLGGEGHDGRHGIIFPRWNAQKSWGHGYQVLFRKSPL